MNSQCHDAMNEWTHLHSCWIDRCVTCAWLCSIFSFWGTNEGLAEWHVNVWHCAKARPRKRSGGRFFPFTKNTKQCTGRAEICLCEPAGRQILAADVQVNSLWVNRLLMHADDSQTGTAQTASLPSISTHTSFNKCCPFIWNWMWQPYVISL